MSYPTCPLRGPHKDQILSDQSARAGQAAGREALPGIEPAASPATGLDVTSDTGSDPPPGARPGSTSPFRTGILLYGGAAALALLNVLEAGLKVSDGDDLWWGMAAGRYITRNLEVPAVDVFSHPFAGHPWINPEWLTHVLFYNIYHHLGENWIVYLRLGLILAIFGIALGLCFKRSKSWLISLLVVAAGAWVCRPFLDARPQLFTFLYSILLLYLLHLFRRGSHEVRQGPGGGGQNLLSASKLVYLIPFIFLAWTQQHGGYFFGLLVLIGNLLAESGKRLLHLPADPLSWRKIRTLAVVTLFSAAAMLVNPWTHQAFTHPLQMSKLISGSNSFLTVTSEWLPPRFFTTEPFNPIQFWFFLFFAALVILPIAVVRWRSFDVNDVGLAAVLAVAFALQHRRFIPLFVILTLPLVSYAVKLWTDRWHTGSKEPAPVIGVSSPLRRGAKATAAVAWLLLASLLPLRLLHLHRSYAVFVHGRFPGNTLFRANTHQVYYPEMAVRFLRQAGTGGLMFNLYNWGGYLEYTLPEHKTFIDGRAQTVFDEPFHRQYLAVRSGSPGWRAVLEQYGVTFALLHSETNAVLFDAMDQDPDWQWVLGHSTSRLLFKRGGENRDLLDRFRARELPLPETGTTYFLYGRQAGEQGEFEQAADDFRRAWELSPENDELRFRWILALSSAGRPEEARKQALEARKERPESAWIRLATARLETEAGRGEEAFRNFEEIFRRWPDRLEAVEGMLEIDFDRARSSIGQVYRDDPGVPWRNYAMGRVAEFEAGLGEARRFYNAEGMDAEQAGDQMRLFRSQQATDRILSRTGAAGAAEGQ